MRKISNSKKEVEVKITYTDDVIKERMGKYGAVYFPNDIKETVDDILGNEIKKEILDDFFKALKKYDDFMAQLKGAKLNPSLTVLLYGPPGTGKTSLTRGFAKKYEIPICVVETDRLVSPLLGDTIKQIRRVVDLSAEIARDRGSFILFFDEIDAIGSERSNIHEVGEIKRAVISFLQVIDRINYEGVPLAIFGATNHQNQLDSAIWRRFTFHLSFEFPDYNLRKQIIEAFLNKVKTAKIGVDNLIFDNLNEEYEKIQEIINSSEKKLGHKVSEFDNILLWNELHKKHKSDGLLELTYGYSGSDIERGTKVAILKAINTERLTYDLFYNSLKIVGGTAIHVERQDILSDARQILKKTNNKKDFPSPREL
ncbi:MAG: AAA family ATPase [Candidatus Hodarchaeota archaeon]